MFRSSTPMIHRKLSVTATVSLLSLVTGFVATIVPAYAQAVQPTQTVPVTKPGSLPPKAVKQFAAVKAFLKNASPSDKKLSARLLFADASTNRGTLPANIPLPLDHFEKDTTGRIRVEIRGKVSPALLTAIANAGGRVLYASPNKLPAFAYPITAYLPPTAMRTLAKRSDVKRIRPASVGITSRAMMATPLVPLIAKPVIAATTTLANTSLSSLTNNLTFAGSVVTEGDRAHGSDWVRYYYGASGFGVKVGVLSDSVFHLTESQTSSDLPFVDIIQDGAGAGEGTAMLEIIHDLAPGANLAFATAFGGEANFADNIRALYNAGCRVIVDDVLYFDEPAFQDGIIAQAVNDVTNAGAIFFSSAGNLGNKTDGTSHAWEGDFSDSGVDLIVNDISPTDPVGRIHQFGAGSLYNEATDIGGIFRLQWSDPQANSANDYDMIVLDDQDNLYDYSANFQTGAGDDPSEGPVVALPGYKVYVVKYSGEDRYMRLWTDPRFGQPVINTNRVTFGHAASKSAVGVAATPASPPGPNTGLFQSYHTVETFSADGPRIMFFNPDGSDITAGNYLEATGGGVLLPKPDLTAADGVTTSFDAASGFNPFYGTSAAAPHAAAIAAQIKSYRRNITVDGLKTVMQNASLDIEQQGFDDVSGAGILMTRNAFDVINKFIDQKSIKLTALTDRTATFYWETNLPSDSFISYRNSVQNFPAVGDGTIITAGSPYPHTVTITGLRPSTRYWATVRSANTTYGLNGTGNTISFVTKPIITPPGAPASNVAVSAVSVARTSATRLVATITLRNQGGTTATNVQITGATLGGNNTITTLPVKVPTVPAYGSAKIVVSFATQPKGTVVATVNATAGGTALTPFSGNVTIP